MRPWVLAGPLLVLVLAAPFIRTLFQPGVAADREIAAMRAVRSVLRHGTLAVPARSVPADETIRAGELLFVKDPPNYLLTLAGVAWLIERGGVTFEENPHLLEYLLIFFAITFPTAVASGLLYRMARVFELRRPVRLALALACVLGTGWFSYAVVLLPHALAAAMLVMAMFGFVQVVLSDRPKLAIGWLFVSGFGLASAVTIEPLAALALVLLPPAILGLPLKWGWRFNAAVVLMLGMAPPLAMHASLTPHITGDLFPPRWHTAEVNDAPAETVAMLADDSEPVNPTIWYHVGRGLNRILTFTIGAHGMLSHFPVLLLGIVGAGIMVHRHWPRTLKWLAGAALAMLVLLVLIMVVIRIQPNDQTFAAAQLVIVGPLLMIWTGAWLRRTHSTLVWSLAGIALGVSVIITLVGATAPAPPGGYVRYTFVEAVAHLLPGAKDADADEPDTQPISSASRR